MYPGQQRYWIALLNLQRTWTDDNAAVAFIPPRHRDFSTPADWPVNKAQAYLLNNLELIRESYRRLEAGEPLDYDLLNHGLGVLDLQLLIAAPRVDEAHGNTTYRLTRVVAPGGHEEVVFSGRRLRLEA